MGIFSKRSFALTQFMGQSVPRTSMVASASWGALSGTAGILQGKSSAKTSVSGRSGSDPLPPLGAGEGGRRPGGACATFTPVPTSALHDYCRTLYSSPRKALIALDLDGTLVLKGDVIPDSALSALADAVDRGAAVVVTTGRRYRIALAPARSLPFPTLLLAHNGALLKETATHRTLFLQEFPPAHLAEVWQFLLDRNLAPVAHVDGYADPPEVLTVAPIPGTYHAQMWGSRYKTIGALLPPGELPQRPVIQLLAFGTPEELHAATQAIAEQFGESLYSHSMRVPHEETFVLEVLHPEGGKWHGVQRAAEALGIAPSRIVTVGDDANDIPMLRGAAVGVAMGNGTEAARTAADAVVAANDADGVAEAVTRFLLPLLN